MISEKERSRWLATWPWSNRTIEDYWLLLNYRDVQALLDTSPLDTSSQSWQSWLDYQGVLLPWVQENSSHYPIVPIPGTQHNPIWFQYQTGLDKFLSLSQVLLTWHGEPATHEQQHVADWFISSHHALHVAFDGSFVVPPEVWQPLRHIAVTVAPHSVCELKHKRNSIIAFYRWLETKHGDNPNPESLRELAESLEEQA